MKSSSLALNLNILLLGLITTTTIIAAQITQSADVVKVEVEALNPRQRLPAEAVVPVTRTRGGIKFNSASIATTSTTTTQPPSLRAPQRRPLATLPIKAATTPKTRTTVIKKKILTATSSPSPVPLQRRRQQQTQAESQQAKEPAARLSPTPTPTPAPAPIAKSLQSSSTSTSAPTSASLAFELDLESALAAQAKMPVNLNRRRATATATATATSSLKPSSSTLSSSSLLRERTARDINLDVGNEFGVRHNLSYQTQTSTKLKRSDDDYDLDKYNSNANSKSSVGDGGDIVDIVDLRSSNKNNIRIYNQRRGQPFQLATLTPPITTTGIAEIKESTKTATESPSKQRRAEVQSSSSLASASSSSQQLKSPRMIQRLVAGHIQNAQGHSTYEVSAVTTNTSVSSLYPTTPTSSITATTTTTTTTTSTTTPRPVSTPLYFRRKQAILSSSYRHSKVDGTTVPTTSSTTSTTSTLATPTRIVSKSHSNDGDDDERDDDEALLDDPGDFDNWDNGILRLSAGSGKEISLASKSKKNKDDAKKTLADQVRDGKYGLIEKELFRREPKRPGILSYLPNKEVPIDNEHNFGGLNEEDIWLAEDHLLVIKGGSLNDGDPAESWAAIDDYDAPGRQIKLPSQPKVPPPFPVQLEENGPIQFIGNNKFTVVYPVANESVPVYSTGPQADYPPSAGDGDNEKNLLTRPGTSEDSPENGPGYFYPAPYPPWLFHNQTFVNTFVKNARPILGPFPFGRNGSFDNKKHQNGTDDFDEDDPSLYYPPAYSFVYKSNYTNPVPPGPLVPGIVLPPPPNQFSRLEKHERPLTSSRQRPSLTAVTSTSTTTTTTTAATISSSTSTTTSTTPIPFRQIITKISEYTPKVITITPSPPVSIPTSVAPKGKLYQTISPKKSKTTTGPIEPVPVPVAVPIPIYPLNYNPTNTVSFVPTTADPKPDTLSQSNPIYYEYFEAKRQPAIKSNIIDDFLSTTVKPPPSPKPIKLYATSKRPFKSQQQHRNYLQPVQPPTQYVADNVVYITPKPPQQAPIFKPRPLENFEREVNAIRETLRYYKNQQIRDNTIPRTPKAKTIYEYSFDATKNLQGRDESDTGRFQPPKQFDEEPFKPMVTYSPAVNDANAFKALAFDKADNDVAAPAQATTTLVPVQPENQYRTHTGRPKKLRLGAKYLQQPIIGNYERQAPGYSGTTPRTVITTQLPWVSLEAKDMVESQQQDRRPERLQPIIGNKNRNFQGYYYRQPLPPAQQSSAPLRQNNRFYDEPFHTPVRKIINYRPQQQINPSGVQQQQQQQWSLENDTYVNYAPNRPPLNPDAEFINPYQTLPGVGVYPAHPQHLGPPPPALSHQSQYYAPPPPPPQRYPLRQLQQQGPPPPPSLHRDIEVNYRQPLPPINPDSEFISHPQYVRNQGNQVYRTNTYRIAPSGNAGVAGSSAGGPQSNFYYITPKYRRASGPISNNKAPLNNGNSQSKSSGSPHTESYGI